MFFGPIDRQPLGHRFVELLALAGGQKKQTMAITAGTVHVVYVAGVDPNLKTVAVFGLGRAAPGRLTLALHVDRKYQARFVPRRADIGHRRPAFQLAQIGQTKLLLQSRARGGP